MNTSRGDSEGPGRLVREKPGFAGRLARAGLGELAALSSPWLGSFVTGSRSSWVRRTSIDSIEVFIKTYDYAGIRDRLRGLLRTTFLAPSRARREWDALSWLRAHGFGGPEPLAVLEHRRRGLLRRAVLVTEAHPGRPLSELLAELAPGDAGAVLRAVDSFVTRLHDAGFRDGNLDLRNLLARPRGDGSWEVVKIDSPRFRIVPPGRGYDRLAQRDWRRLARQLPPLPRPRSRGSGA